MVLTEPTPIDIAVGQWAFVFARVMGKVASLATLCLIVSDLHYKTYLIALDSFCNK